MLRVFILVGSLFLVASCANTPANNKGTGWLSEDTAKIERTKKLFACSSFFRIVASQRPQDSKKYNDLASQARSSAFSVMPAYKEANDKVKTELTKKYNVYGNYESRSWVKEIGKDQTGQRFPQITRDCYKTTQKESLFNTVDELNDKLNKNSK